MTFPIPTPAAWRDLEGGAASVILSGAVLGGSEPLGQALAGVALDAGLDGPDAANALAVMAAQSVWSGPMRQMQSPDRKCH